MSIYHNPNFKKEPNQYYIPPSSVNRLNGLWTMQFNDGIKAKDTKVSVYSIELNMDYSLGIIGNHLFVITEKENKEMYYIRCKYVQDLIDDWYGEHKMCPSDNARVFFASWNGKPVNPYIFTDFKSLMKVLPKLMVRGE